MANEKKDLHLEEKNNEEGASLVEYALLVALIAVITIAAIGIVGTSTSEAFSGIAHELGEVQ